jgi:hypothetical protein
VHEERKIGPTDRKDVEDLIGFLIGFRDKSQRRVET